MVSFILEGHSFGYDIQTAIQVFLPNRHYYPAEEIGREGMSVKSMYKNKRAEAQIYKDGLLQSEGFVDLKEETEKEIKHAVKEAIFLAFNSLTGYMPKWGMITGVRPAKTASEMSAEGKTDDEILSYFKNRFYVSDNKAKLALDVSKAEKKILEANTKDDVSIYVGIPFCPTRCLYCSFTSYPIDRYAKKADEYLDKLEEEIKFISENIKGRKIRSLYVGGGTPTSLSNQQFARLMEMIVEHFDLSNADEFTVEAGRPDTVTKEKLISMKKANVSRISINPQTMNDKTLDLIGRRHSVEDIKNAFKMAREQGFDNINMDIILGLPEESVDDVENTMKEIEKLSPESVTVHTLAVKRASRLKEKIDDFDLTAAEEMEKMIEISKTYAEKMGLFPYYMYRQKAMIGNFENVGYCKAGCESVYNIEIMEEKQSIIAAGAGASSKLYDFNKNLVVRVFNVKSVEEYLGRFDEMIKRKESAFGENIW